MNAFNAGLLKVKAAALAGNTLQYGHGGGTRDDRSTITFGHVRVRTPAPCMAGECFIHCAMPLGLVTGTLWVVNKTLQASKSSFLEPHIAM